MTPSFLPAQMWCAPNAATNIDYKLTQDYGPLSNLTVANKLWFTFCFLILTPPKLYGDLN